MSTITIAFIMIVALFIAVICGIHIGFSLALMSVLGIVWITGNWDTGIYILATTSFESLRSYSFAVIPLYMLMGSFMSNSNAAKNLYKAAAIVLRKLPGGLGVATVFANAVFAAVTGVSVASAAIFSKIAVPEMRRNHYNPAFAAGSVAGSSVLGMLIPPSLMFILYGMLAEVSIGKLFIAGVVPGVLLAIMFSGMIIYMAVKKPKSVFDGYTYKQVLQITEKESGDINYTRLFLSVVPTVLLIILVLGGIWGGFFTPTEASGIGALGALLIGFSMGMGIKGFKKALLETASGVSAILFLLITATMYSRMLTMSGLVNWLNDIIIGMDVSAYVILSLFMLIVIFLGCVLDSSSIMLIVVPLMVPIISDLGFNLIWFGVILVLFVHMGLLTPPFGMCVFSVKVSISDQISIEKIFKSCGPYLIIMLIHSIICIVFPKISTWLPSLM